MKARIRALCNKRRRGETLVEVILAIGILCTLLISIVTTMIAALGYSQSSLEESMSQSEIDMQAEALRFIHNAYTYERNFTASNQQYAEIWNAVKGMAITPSEIVSLNSVDSCNVFYERSTTAVDSIYNNTQRSFLINTHKLLPGAAANEVVLSSVTTNYETSIFQPATLYPRTLYGTLTDKDTVIQYYSDRNDDLALAEGIWVTAVCSDTNPGGFNCSSQPQYYDFYIRTCWESGNDHITSTNGTIVRLHNPDLRTTGSSGGIPELATLHYVITYDPGDSPNSPKVVTGTCASSCTVPLNWTPDAPAGRTFGGWTLDSGAVVTSVTPTMSNPEITVHAKWVSSH